MATPEEFANRMRGIANSLEGNASRLVRKVALAVDSTVVLGTPVKTGRARANWQVAIGVAPSRIKYPSPEKPGSPESGTQEALQQGSSVIGEYTTGVIHVTNNLPYIKRLNEGYSTQAPAGYVEMAVLAAKDAIKDSQLISTTVTTEKF